MKFLIYMRCGKPVEIEADEVKCVDHKAQVYKMFRKADPAAINKQTVAIVISPDLILELDEPIQQRDD